MPGVALTSTAGGGEASPSPGVVEPRKQEELGSRLLARRPFTLPFPLLTSPPASDAAEDDDEDEEEVGLLLPDPITHQPAPSSPHLTDPRIDQERPPLPGHNASLPRDGAWVRVAACATPRWARTGTSAAVAAASLLPPLQTLA